MYITKKVTLNRLCLQRCFSIKLSDNINLFNSTHGHPGITVASINKNTKPGVKVYIEHKDKNIKPISTAQ
jgi:hypothetical protein